MGKTFAEVASLVDENDRRSLGDPVRKALDSGGRVTMGGARCWCLPTPARSGRWRSA